MIEAQIKNALTKQVRGTEFSVRYCLEEGIYDSNPEIRDFLIREVVRTILETTSEKEEQQHDTRPILHHRV